MRELQEAVAQLRTQLDAVQYQSEVETKYARREGKARVGAAQRVFVQEVSVSVSEPLACLVVHLPVLVLFHQSITLETQERDLARKLSRLQAQAAMEQKAHDDLAAYLRGMHEVGGWVGWVGVGHVYTFLPK